jgi:hypothetical protein
MTEILLKVVLNTINPKPNPSLLGYWCLLSLSASFQLTYWGRDENSDRNNKQTAGTLSHGYRCLETITFEVGRGCQQVNLLFSSCLPIHLTGIHFTTQYNSGAVMVVIIW